MMKTYEAMFLVDPSTASKDGKMPEYIHNMLDKYNAKILKEMKWADKNLAYKIKGHRRGTYYLSYFETEPENISKIRNECDLSTVIVRSLILFIEPSMKEKMLSSCKEPVASASAITAETKK
ncbi:MAG: 30S ribosomal protein S6 [Planctomycetes bacterium]|nr:30S ribosomal protein S6 [Planctomycetota bacterium]